MPYRWPVFFYQVLYKMLDLGYSTIDDAWGVSTKRRSKSRRYVPPVCDESRAARDGPVPEYWEEVPRGGSFLYTAMRLDAEETPIGLEPPEQMPSAGYLSVSEQAALRRAAPSDLSPRPGFAPVDDWAPQSYVQSNAASQTPRPQQHHREESRQGPSCRPAFRDPPLSATPLPSHPQATGHGKQSQLQLAPRYQLPHYHERPGMDNKYEMFLYIFSGVLLLFVLEQFLQIGVHIGTRSMHQSMAAATAAASAQQQSAATFSTLQGLQNMLAQHPAFGATHPAFGGLSTRV